MYLLHNRFSPCTALIFYSNNWPQFYFCKLEYRSGKIYEILESLSDPLLDENALVQMKEDYEFSLLEDSITIDMAKFMRILLRWQQKDRESIRRLIVVCFYLWNKIPEAKALLKILFYLSKDDTLIRKITL